MTIDEKLDFLISEMQSMREGQERLEQRQERLEQQQNKLQATVERLEQNQERLEQKQERLEQKQLQTQVTLEDTINKCITALGEGYRLNAERLDVSNLESLKNQSDMSVMIAKATNEKVDRLIDKLNQSA